MVAAAAFIVLGFNATFIPQFLLGNAGHAAPLLHVPDSDSLAAQRGLDRRARTLLAFGLHHHLHLPGLLAPERGRRGRQPLGGAAVSSGRPPHRRPSTTSTETPIVDEDAYTYQKKGEKVEHVVV